MDDELRRAGVRRPTNTIGIGWAGPTLLFAGTPAQKDRYLLPLLAGEEIWCQLFSEPGAGSDLASLTTRAVLDGDEWVVQGSKIWTSYAHSAQFGILLARTEPDAPVHQGISYFICPMDAPGVTVRPLIDMTGAHTFNQVFLDDVRIPAANLVGTRGQGWSLAKVTLGNERVSLSGRRRPVGHGADGRRPGRPGAPLRRRRRSPAAPAAGPGVGRGGDPPAAAPADGVGGGGRARSRAPRHRCARRWPTSTAST